ncbi:hypothetical protein SUGI_0113630 [Cryptomeria japonica]|nr:hypothetical protein SUGI_0113630 [Cryptomeria japonica]
MNMVEKLLEEMATGNLKPDEVTYNTVIDGLCKAGDLSRAQSLLNRMLDAVTYNCLIDAHCKVGEMDKYFLNMKVAGIAPNVVTYNILIGSVQGKQT